MTQIIYAMIPARVGSTRLKLKNLSLIAGKPLIEYAIDAAKDSQVFDRVVINGDHRIFEKISERCCVDFYQRRGSLGSSQTKSDEVVFDFFQNHPEADILAWVNTIAPFQTSGEIREATNFFVNKELDSLITVEEKKVHANFRNEPINYSPNEVFSQTQDLLPVNIFTYSLMMWRRETFISQYLKNGFALFSGKFATFKISRLTGHIIKDELDLAMANAMMKMLKLNNPVHYDPLVEEYEKAGHFF